MLPRPPTSPLFPYTTLFRSRVLRRLRCSRAAPIHPGDAEGVDHVARNVHECTRRSAGERFARRDLRRSEEHTSELQSHSDLVCRLLLEKKKTTHNIINHISE